MPGTAEASEPRVRSARPVLRTPLLFALIFSAIFILHAPLLRLPYFWDEAGYYVPAARDLLLTGDLIPRSTVSNAHPPLVPAYLAVWWKLSGYTPAVTRTAMLLVAALALLGLFRLARQVTNTQVAAATTLCTALYPVFFAQSSLAHLDVAAAGLTFWALYFYLAWRGQPGPRVRLGSQSSGVAAIAFFSLAALAKETAVITPLTLCGWELICPLVGRAANRELCLGSAPDYDRSHASFGTRLFRALPLLVPLLPLAAWFAYHLHRTGYVFGNPEFFRYNIAATLHPLRILVALGTRLWQLLGYMNLFILTIATAMAMTFPPLRNPASARAKAGGNGNPEVERRPLVLPVQAILAVVILAHVIVLSVVGGAVLARYLLPATPLAILICISTLRRRLPWWPAVVAVVCLGFVVGLFVNPPWHFAPEDNLAYRDYVLLHKGADGFVASHYPQKIALTAWPASDEITRPWLGYVPRTVRVLRIEDFTVEQVLAARQQREAFDLVLAFSTKYEPRVNLLERLPFWERLQARYFGYHRDLPPDAIARILGGRIVYDRSRGGQWIAVIDLEHVENAEVRMPPAPPRRRSPQ